MLALLTLGEGWHNNHHRHAHLCRQGQRWWEVDVTWYVLAALEKLHIVWGVRRHNPTDEVDREIERARRRSSTSTLSSSDTLDLKLSGDLVPGKAEQAFADHVALDLRGPAGDRQRPVAEEPAEPPGPVALVDGPAGAQQVETDLLDALFVLDAQQLADARLRTGLVDPPEPSPIARSVVRTRSTASAWDVTSRSPIRSDTSARSGCPSSSAPVAVGQVEHREHARSERRAGRHRHPFVLECRPGTSPAVVHRPDHAVVRARTRRRGTPR